MPQKPVHHGRNHFIVEHISIIRYPIGCREEDGDSIRSSGSFPSGILMEKLLSLKGEGLDGETHIRIDDYGTTFVDKSYHDENILAEDVSVMPVELSVTVLLIHPGGLFDEYFLLFVLIGPNHIFASTKLFFILVLEVILSSGGSYGTGFEDYYDRRDV